MNLQKSIQKLCYPSYIYFVLSVIVFIAMMIQNVGNTNVYCVGSLSCNVENNIYIFVMNAIYILIWTIILDSLCKNGYKELSWFLVLFPFILFFLLLAMFLFK